MPSILLTNFYDAKSLDVIKALLPKGFNLLSLLKPGKEEVFRLVDKAEYIIAGGRVPIDRELLDQANRLRMIQRSGVGLDKIDVDTLKKKDIPLYMDGARIFEAAVALGESVKSLCEPVDAVMFCLSKGLSAPVGSMLCGSRAFIQKARKIRKLLGGTMRQAGIIAANGLIALEPANIKQLKTNHDNAKKLANNMTNQELLDVNPSSVQTNMVTMNVTKAGWDADAFTKSLETKGVLAKVMQHNTIRFVTYTGINENDINQAIKSINATTEDFLNQQTS